MNLYNSDIFSVLIPTFQGTRFLKRVLDYFQTIEFKGQIVLSDNSSGQHRHFVSTCQDEFASLRIKTILYPAEIRFLDKIVDSLEQIDSRFVMLHAHDDFMIPTSVEECVTFLEKNPGYSVARGRIAMFAVAGDTDGGRSVQFVAHPMRAYEHEDAVERMIAHIERYASTFYSVHNREDLLDAFRITEAATKNVIFFQYLSSCICALKGKIWCSNDLFYVRQGHGDSWSGTLKQSSYEHWPLLITSPKFSDHYQEFRAALTRYVGANFNQASVDIGSRIDRAALGLFQRSYCGTEQENPGETQFINKLHDPSSDEHKALGWVVNFIQRHPETI